MTSLKLTREWAAAKAGEGGRAVDQSRHINMVEAEEIDPANQFGRMGEVLGIVIRQNDGHRLQPSQARLTPNEGLIGDRWFLQNLSKDSQISMMNASVAYDIANGQSVVMFGDNLFVDFDLSEEALPVRARIQIGDVVLSVSPKPHTPCHLFRERFGDPAFRVAAKNLRIRGILLRVEREGHIAIGDLVSRLD